MKREETKRIEAILYKNCFASNNMSLAKRYGCAEVTVGFPTKRVTKEKRNEVVDFLSYDRKSDCFYCYEIKVSLPDLKSDAAKSFHGDFNYIVVTNELYDDHRDAICGAISDNTGVIVCDISTMSMRIARPARGRKIPQETANILKDSLLRSLFYKHTKNKEIEFLTADTTQREENI